MDKKEVTREEIVVEYLTGNISYRALEKKYGVPSRSICDWVLKYQGRLPSWREKEKRRKPITTFSDHWMRKYPNLIEEF